jgi:hypothetical protein
MTQMPKRIEIAPHLNLEELEHRYRQAQDGVERSHYSIIWLLAQGKLTEEVAELTSSSRSWIYAWVWGYHRNGAEALGDQRHHNPGAQPLLNDLQPAQLWQLLQEPPTDGDLWDGPKVGVHPSFAMSRSA